MNPLVAVLLGLTGAFLLLGESGGRRVPAPLPPILPQPFIPPASVSIPPLASSTPKASPKVDASDIEKAYHIALTKETSAANLRQFGSALIVLGYGKEGASLLSKANHQQAKAVTVSTSVSTPSGQNLTHAQALALQAKTLAAIKAKKDHSAPSYKPSTKSKPKAKAKHG